MRIAFIMKKITEYALRRKLNFFLTTLVMVTAIYMLSLVLQIAVNSTYNIYKTKSLFTDKEILNVNILSTEMYDKEYNEKVESFIDELEYTYGSNMGKFMYLPASYNVFREVRAEETLYIDINMVNLCRLKLTEDEKYALSAERSDMLRGYVCKNRLDEYPLGTIIENKNIGSRTMIIGYFDEGSEWIPALLLHSTEATVCLDDYIVSEMDEKYFEIDKAFYSNAFNNIYVETDGKAETVKKNVKSISEKHGVMCYVNTIDEIIQKEKYENRDLLKAVGGLVSFAVIIAMTGIFCSFSADVFSWQRDIAIMSVNNVSPVDIFMILFLENLIKALIAFNIAVFLYGNNLGKSDKIMYFQMIVPIILTGLFVFIIITSFAAFKTIKQNRLIAIIGGEHL